MGVTRLFDGLDMRLAMLLCGGLLFTACAGGEVIGDADAEGDAAEDLGAEETTDSGARDTGAADTGATDAGDAGDTTVTDTTTADTTVADTTDTGVEDTTVADTTPEETDAAVPDPALSGCGNGIVEGAEACDDGSANSNSRPNACRTDCSAARCGDLVVDLGETCDDGNLNDGDFCSNVCVAVSSWICSECATDADCGGVADQCVQLTDGLRCLRACATVNDCIAGQSCAIPAGETIRQCVPTSGSCGGCVDSDRDGYGIGTACSGADCNDLDAAIHPGAPENCDLRDNDCDGAIDDGLPSARLWPDTDGDGFGNGAALSSRFCSNQPGMVANNSDCDDTRATVHPDLTDSCDLRDNDCDGEVDEDAAILETWPDADGDGHGDAAVAPVTGCVPGEPRATVGDDCDDLNGAVYPGATEACDGIDNNCEAGADEGAPTSPFWPDADGDGRGNGGGAIVESCAQPAGYVTSTDDCNDGAANIFPGAPEGCDGQDNNCNGLRDDGATGCPCTTASYGSHNYLVCGSQSLSWNDAENFCLASGYHLVTVSDGGENSWLSGGAGATGSCDDSCRYPNDGDCDDGGPGSIFSYCTLGTDCTDCGPRGGFGGNFWIGYNDIASEGSFGWSSGAPAAFASWNSGEPNNSSDEDCAEFRLGGNNWNDLNCGAAKAFICETLD
jgi:cysteine-rich repeat protein